MVGLTSSSLSRGEASCSSFLPLLLLIFLGPSYPYQPSPKSTLNQNTVLLYRPSFPTPVSRRHLSELLLSRGSWALTSVFLGLYLPSLLDRPFPAPTWAFVELPSLSDVPLAESGPLANGRLHPIHLILGNNGVQEDAPEKDMRRPRT